MSADCGFGSAKGGDAPAQKVFADMNPLEALLFASSSTENCATIRSAGIELKPVAIFDLLNSNVSLHPDVSSPSEIEPDECYTCHSELVETNDDRKTAFLRTMTSLLNGHLVTRMRIIFTNNYTLSNILIRLLLPFLAKGKVYDWVAFDSLKKELSHKNVHEDKKYSSCGSFSNVEIASMFRSLTELIPMRRLYWEFLGCGRDDCTAPTDLIYKHFHPNVECYLEHLNGDLHNWPHLVTRFPMLRHYINTRVVPQNLAHFTHAHNYLSILAFAQKRIKEWTRGGDKCTLGVSVRLDQSTISTNISYHQFIVDCLAFFHKELRISGDSYATVYSMTRADGERLECTVSFNQSQASIKCLVYEKTPEKDVKDVPGKEE